MISIRTSEFSPAAQADVVREILGQSLYAPLQDFYSRPRKDLRGQLVRIGFDLIHHGEIPEECFSSLQLCAEAIEALHTGSLIVDDIEDQSEWRRGGPSLHLRYGLPRALNAGNWLYFYAFERLRRTEIDADRKLQLYELGERVLMEAHMGQALDLSCDISKLQAHEITKVCHASLELKSGALMGLALGWGGILAGASPEKRRSLLECGVELGVNLQMFDDLGNLRLDAPTSKHLEDLCLRRPSFLWWHLAEDYPDLLPAFTESCENLPNTEKLSRLLQQNPVLETGRQKALRFQEQLLEKFKTNLASSHESLNTLRKLAERLAHAYT